MVAFSRQGRGNYEATSSSNGRKCSRPPRDESPPKREQAGMNEREYKDFLRNGPVFFVHANMLEFLVFPGFLARRGVFLPLSSPGRGLHLTVLKEHPMADR